VPFCSLVDLLFKYIATVLDMYHIRKCYSIVFTLQALVIPAFETQRYRFTFPESKELLLKLLDSNELYTFR